jgi:hypothetical protein
MTRLQPLAGSHPDAPRRAVSALTSVALRAPSVIAETGCQTCIVGLHFTLQDDLLQSYILKLRDRGVKVGHIALSLGERAGTTRLDLRMERLLRNDTPEGGVTVACKRR